MEIYRRLVRCIGADELKHISDGVADAYGPPPAAMRTLLDLAEVRVRAGAVGIDSIIRVDNDLVFGIHDFKKCEKVFKGAVGSVRLPDDRTVYWRPPPAFLQPESITNVLLRRLRVGEQSVQ